MNRKPTRRVVVVVTRRRARARARGANDDDITEMLGDTERDTLLRAEKIVDVEAEMRASGDLQHPTATTARRAIIALSTALIASLAMNAVQYTYVGLFGAKNSPLGSGYALAAPKGLPREVHLDACGHGPRFSLMCVGEREDRRGSWRPSAMLGQAANDSEEEEEKSVLGGATNTDVEPLGADALHPATGLTRYCRKDTWLLSCLFYKANINDEATDWKHVKEECDGEFECDGVNKYWTSDLWHIASSGNADGCDVSLLDGSGTDASAFYKEGSAGWHQYGPTGDGSCKIVNSWGNPE